MPLEPGQQLLHYRLTDKIGEGGMGVVWKATDTTLGREVAIKVLPEGFADDPDRRTRFEREARLLASLDHPGVAAVYGLHEQDGMHFLAMELVEGEDLSVRLSRGKLPVEDALEIAGQICDAFAAAHDAGVIHRDLKPANVMVTADGKVKVLDFGLAKALIGDPASGAGASASISPTMTSHGTRAGMILGTAAYMSPEQARGKPVDRRADIWALGCVLFELLTGKSAFGGETVTDTLASVVRAEPDWDALPPETPTSVRRVLRRALEKDPARRLRDAGDVRLELDDASADAPASTPPARRNPWSGLLWALGGAGLALIAAWVWLAPPPPAPSRPTRFEVFAATGETAIDRWSLTLSPDGRRIAWIVLDGTQSSILVRELDSLETVRLPDTEGASRLAFSPDGRSIAFFAKNKLRRFDLGDRNAIDLCDATEGAGITWGDDGTIVFNAGWISALSRVPEGGGTPEPATRLDEEDGEIGHWFPDLLPDGRHVLISRWRTALNDMSVGVASLEDGTIRDLVPRASYARFAPPDRLLFTRAGAIHVVPFDPERQEVTGTPTVLVDGVEQMWDNGGSTWTVSATGTLAYLQGGIWSANRTIARVSRTGEIRPMEIEPGAYLHVDIAPDGKRLAMTRFENGNTDVLIRDLARGVDTRVPLDATNAYPVWHPDGAAIVFDTAQKGPWDIYRYGVDGASEPEMLIEGRPDQVPLDWSPDGRYLLWDESGEGTRAIDVLGDSTPETVLPDSSDLAFSPDSRWVAYDTSIAGRSEVLVRRFPDGDRDHRISIEGGSAPLWSHDGRELFFRRGNLVLAASIRATGDDLVAERPRELFRGSFVYQDRHEWSYDPTTDELIMIVEGDGEIRRDRFVVVTDWPAGVEETSTAP